MNKTIRLEIPSDKKLPDALWTFSPEENGLLVEIGCEVLLAGRKAVMDLTEQEMHKKMKEETRHALEKMERELCMQRQVSLEMEKKTVQLFEGQIEQIRKRLERSEELNQMLQMEIKKQEQEDAGKIREAVEKAREKFDWVLAEKEKQLARVQDVYERINENVMKLANKSTAAKGMEGEKQFSELAETFVDFKGFELIDKHTQGGQGDFHMHFEEFDVLVDAKNYKKKVPIDQREKIKKDLIKNQHIRFAWLVSLNTSIEKWDKSPVMYEWINGNQCVVYVNQLCGFEDPKKILRMVWYTCKELYRWVENTQDEETEMVELRETKGKLLEKMKNVRKAIREINTSMQHTKNLVQSMDDEIRDLLETETKDLLASNFSLFEDWWTMNVETTEMDTMLLSTDVWMKFRNDNKQAWKEMDVTTEKFKKYIKSKVPSSNVVFKGKNPNSAFEIRGLRWKKK
jgi:hypothetical protein